LSHFVERWTRLAPPYRAMPARIQAAIAIQQDDSERLAAWIQLGIVCFFTALYAVAPKTYDGDLMYPPVTIALGGFVIAALLRLGVAQKGGVPGWFVGGMVLVDITLLLGLVWSFHMQYGQPPAFSLKAPTMLYLFIFIALRALRFEARYVLLAGGAAAGGWMLLASWAVFADPGMVTRDYVHYLTANAVLIGAEIDKVITILVVTGVLALALARARRLLVVAIMEASAAQELSRFFAPEVASRITAAENQLQPGHGEAREATVLTVDIRGFTQLSNSLQPSALFGLLVEYQARIVPVIHEYGGTIDKFLGDGILASFGAPEPSETHAADALRALDAIVAAIDGWNRERQAERLPELAFGAAAVAGRLVCGAVGDSSRLEYTVIGEPVNLAVKLEKFNKQVGARAVVPLETYDLALKQGFLPAQKAVRLSAQQIAGVEGKTDVVIVAG
jgi:adenylate cyclase